MNNKNDIQSDKYNYGLFIAMQEFQGRVLDFIGSVVDFREEAKEILDICTYIHKSEGRATEKIECILMQAYEKGKSEGMKVALDCFVGK